MEMWKMVKYISMHHAIDVYIDVGSHVGGFYEHTVSPFLPNAEVFFFEPTSYNFKRLREKYIGEQFSVYNFAVADKCADSIDFYVSNDDPSEKFNGMGNTLIQEGKPSNTVSVEKIKLVSLNNCYETRLIKQPDFIKIDAQGADLLVIKGASLLLSNTKFVLAELQTSDISSSIVYMESIGWKLYNISMEKGWISERGRLGECNVMFYNHQLLGDM